MKLLNPKLIGAGIVGAFAIIVAIVAFSGPSFIDDVSGGSLFSPSGTPREVLPLEIQLDDISILEVNERAATIEVEFTVTNPNFKSVILHLIKYELYENNVRIAISEIGKRPVGMVDASNYFTILSEKPTTLKDKVTIENTGNLPELWNSLANNTPQWNIKGEAFFNLSSMIAGGENKIIFEFTK